MYIEVIDQNSASGFYRVGHVLCHRDVFFSIKIAKGSKETEYIVIKFSTKRITHVCTIKPKMFTKIFFCFQYTVCCKVKTGNIITIVRQLYAMSTCTATKV